MDDTEVTSLGSQISELSKTACLKTLTRWKEDIPWLPPPDSDSDGEYTFVDLPSPILEEDEKENKSLSDVASKLSSIISSSKTSYLDDTPEPDEITISISYENDGLRIVRSEVSDTESCFFSGSDYSGASSEVESSESDVSVSSGVAIPVPKKIWDVLVGVGSQKKTRLQDDIADELERIHGRVRNALKNVDDEDEDDLFKKMQRGRQYRLKSITQTFDILSNTAKLAQRNSLLSRIGHHLEKCEERLCLLKDVQYWIVSQHNLENLELTGKEMDELMQNVEDAHINVIHAVDFFSTACNKVAYLGEKLLSHVAAIMKENDYHKKGKKPEKVHVFDEKALLEDASKLEAAGEQTVRLFDEATKLTKNVHFRSAFRQGQRQTKHLLTAVRMVQKDNAEKEKNADEAQNRLLMNNTVLEKYQKQVNEQAISIKKLQIEANQARELYAQEHIRNKTLQEKVKSGTDLIERLEAEILELQKKPPPPAPPPPPPATPSSHSMEYVRVVEPDTEELDRMQREFDEETRKYQALILELEERIKTLEEDLKFEKDQCNELQHRLFDLEKQDKTVVELPKLPEPVIETDGKDANYYKTIIAGMRNEFSSGIDKMKNHHKKELQRSEATKRRLETVQKEQMTSILKDTTRMIRSIVHLRDAMSDTLFKENLKDHSNALQQLPKLVQDPTLQEPKEVLQMLALSTVEYLHHMEDILSNAFLALRVTFKRQAQEEEQNEQRQLALQKQAEAAREMETQLQKMKTGHKRTLSIQGHVGKTKKHMQKVQKMMLDKMHKKDNKYISLMGRYTLLWRMYNKLQKELSTLETDFEETLTKTMEDRENFLVTQMQMGIKKHRAQCTHDLELSIKDQGKNLQLLDQAFEENKISKDLHIMSTALIQKAMEIPRKRFVYLVNRYMAQQHFLQTQNMVRSMLDDEDIAFRTRQEMHSYLERQSERFQENMTLTNQERSFLENERRRLFSEIYRLFNEVLVETGLLLIHPMLKEDKSSLIVRAARSSQINRHKLKKLMQHKHMATFQELPKAVVGTNMPLSLNLGERGWPNIPEGKTVSPQPGVDTPYLLNFDVNRRKLCAARALRRIERQHIVLSVTQEYNITEHKQKGNITEQTLSDLTASVK